MAPQSKIRLTYFHAKVISKPVPAVSKLSSVRVVPPKMKKKKLFSNLLQQWPIYALESGALKYKERHVFSCQRCQSYFQTCSHSNQIISCTRRMTPTQSENRATYFHAKVISKLAPTMTFVSYKRGSPKKKRATYFYVKIISKLPST